MGIPERLSDWTIDAIRSLLEAGCTETDRFDFKECIAGRGADHSARLRGTACAFANTYGGFLVFGVRDKGTPADRLVGLPPGEEHATQLADLLAPIEPSLVAVPQNPAQRLQSGNVILVAEIVRGRFGPHWDPKVREFYRRVHGRNVEMSREEVRMAFVDQEERVRRIHMVYLSIIDNWLRLEACVAPEGGSGPIPLAIPDPTVLRAQFIEFPTLCPDLVEPIMWIIRDLDEACARLNQLLFLLNEDHSVKSEIAARHRYEINNAMKYRLRPRMDLVLEALKNRFGFAPIKIATPRELSLPPLPDYWPQGRMH